MKRTRVEVLCDEVVVSLPDGVKQSENEKGQFLQEPYDKAVDLRLIYTTISEATSRNLVQYSCQRW